jgi:hypothetical protein
MSIHSSTFNPPRQEKGNQCAGAFPAHIRRAAQRLVWRTRYICTEGGAAKIQLGIQ